MKLDENEKYQIKFYGEMSIRKYRKMPTRKLKQFWRNVEWASYVDTVKMGWWMMFDKDKLIEDLEQSISDYELKLFNEEISKTELIKIYGKIEAYNDILQGIALRIYED